MKTEAEKTKLIFVYNAGSGVFNLLSDIAHKVFSPETYACNLRAITHSNFGMRKEWKAYLDSLGNRLEFFHAYEFKDKHPVKNITRRARRRTSNALNKKTLKLAAVQTVFSALRLSLSSRSFFAGEQSSVIFCR